ncbi:Na+/H+ antiporter [Paraflavitalea sp. CAU 1676]|uniref:Na+/H+ antiporter n=1 Tax=Paraflavitalea sp. CAU 1676 TaxID=3032598 RepID=UPI0023DA6A9E|nr:Na+/H+ antiporter [Paraflavitalea sp. CAU 1676]MDF2189120.1 Na+/H+ antiporter [Paraflavitalea sp. CAU 1676]
MHNNFIIYIVLVLAILLLVMLAKRIRVSYPILLVVAGLLISFIPGLPAIEIDPELIFVIFLPPLLYEAAWKTSWKEFWRWRRVISSFAFLIVILTSCVVAVFSNWLIPTFTLALGFLLGGIISPPDAVSASSILQSVKVPKRLVSIVEGESLLNDAASLIVFRFALVAVNTGVFVFREAAWSFVVVIVMGILTGIAIALVFYAMHRWLPTTPQINIVLSFIAPYVMYIVAEQFHFSGVLAVVSGGLFLSVRSHHFLDHRSRIQGWNVWETIAFVLNGLVFMLIGLELPVVINSMGEVSLRTAIWYSAAISLLVIVLRLACTFGASVFTVWVSKYITTADNRPGWKGPLVLGWAGMRGVVSLAAALSIPAHLKNGSPFPERNLILFITFSVILVTLVLQGLTLPALIRWVKLEDRDHIIPEEEQDALVKKKMSQAALRVLREQHADKLTTNTLLQSLQTRLQAEVDVLGGSPGTALKPNEAKELIPHYQSVYLELLNEQRTLLHNLNRKAEVDEAIVRKYLSLLDIEEEKLFVQYHQAGH